MYSSLLLELKILLFLLIYWNLVWNVQLDGIDSDAPQCIGNNQVKSVLKIQIYGGISTLVQCLSQSKLIKVKTSSSCSESCQNLGPTENALYLVGFKSSFNCCLNSIKSSIFVETGKLFHSLDTYGKNEFKNLCPRFG